MVSHLATLIKLGLGTSDPLVNWAVRTTAEAAVDRRNVLEAMLKDGDRDGAIKWLCDARWAKSGAALARGSDIHRAAEARALGEPVEVDVQNIPLLEQYDRFLQEFQPEFLMAEAPVYAPEYGFAGTLDAVAVIDGVKVVMDIKTTQYGPNSGKTRPPYAETALQLAGYAHATKVGLLSEQRYAGGRRYYLMGDGPHEPMPKTEGGIVVVVSPEDYLVVPVRTDETVFKYFRHVIECARWQVSESKNVFGGPLKPKVTA